MMGTSNDGNRYAPEYTYETASVHNDNDVVVWLGNNGKLTVEIDTGIALTKRVTEAIGNPDDTYNLTVTVPVGVNADPEVKDANGGTVASTYSGNVLTIPVKVDQTVYITGIPGGTVCAIGEIIPAGKDYYISDSTATVTVPTLVEVPVGENKTVTVSFQVEVTAEDAVVANTAIVRDGVNEYVTNEVVNHTFEEVFVKDVFAADAPTVSIDGQKVEAGDELVYEIRFTNASGEAKDITITDSIPAGTTYEEGSADRDGVYENGVIVWQLQNVAPWETVIVTFKVKVNEQNGEATIRNRATATEGENTYETNPVSNHMEERQPENPGASDNPQTGDDTKLHLWVTLLVISSLGFGATILLGRKKENEIL